ncbi:L-2-amino-thiazoline-4-carboxylic acid hydrolase [Saccharopolyspora shandongensis]|uniref:L-2-amino-thiazoline-4-carboxylic acid hydrolase n=1 Tax=Saccharopolyspora shandongensis TaxID=418495 RepID=UPI00344AFF96
MTTDEFGLTDENYVPDPDRDTAMLVDGFFEHIAGILREQAEPDDLLATMRRRHEALETADQHLIVDEPARYNLRLTLALVAAYEILRPRLGREAAIDAVRDALVEPLGEALRTGTRAMLDSAADPFRAMVELAKTREHQSFGEGFEFRHPVDDDRRFHADIHRCFYYDVLVANSAPELAPAMCDFDRNWIDAIDPDEHGFRFERATTIGLGGTHCPFHFSRTDG